jgi:hypothetical protein
MPNHRPILVLAFAAWLAGAALAVQAASAPAMDGDPARFHLAAALAVLVATLLAFGWPALYARGVRSELGRTADLPPAVVDVARQSARQAERWAWFGLAALGLLAAGGVATHLGHLRPARHGLSSLLALLGLLVACLAETRHLGRLRRALLELERSRA